MTAAFGAFANRGLLSPPTLIRRVEAADGSVLYEAETEPTRVIKETTAFLMTTMMADVINAGTAWTARREGFMLPAAGKTGTTNDYHDAWFVGYTPKLVTGVWVGFDQPRTIVNGGYAAELAVPLWGRFMKAATSSHKTEYFRVPRGVTTARICRLTGARAGEGCRNATYTNDKGEVVRGSLEYTEYFAAGTEPTHECPLHPAGGGQTILASGSGRPMPGAMRTVQAPVVTDQGVPTQVTETPAEKMAEAEKVDEKKGEDKKDEQKPEEKKRGFWGRIFGR
jgi:penicillin-binding protein 1A